MRIILAALFALAILIPSAYALATPQFLYEWGSKGTGDGQFIGPQSAAITGNTIYILENGADRVQAFDLDGNFLFTFGSGFCRVADGFGCTDPDGHGPLEVGDGQFGDPAGIAVSENTGNVYVLDKNNGRVQIFDANGNFLDKFGQFGTVADGDFNFPIGIALDDSDNIYVADSFNSRVQKFDSSGNHLLTIGGTFGNLPGQFKEPKTLDVAENGNVYIGDPRNHRVQVFDSAGNFLFKFGSFGTGDGQFTFEAQGVGIDGAGNVYVGDFRASRYQIFDANGNFLDKFGSFGTGNGQFTFAGTSPEFDNQGRVFIVDTRNDRVEVFSGLNNSPDCSVVSSSSDSIWPPNHKFVNISINGVTDPDGDDITILITGITQDEAIDAKGSGKTSPDGILNGDSAQVRAERTGSGDGRVYEISFIADDGNGASCSNSVLVGVPHDKKSTAVNSGQNFDSTS